MRKLKKYPIGPLYTSVLFLMCKFHWSRIHLRLVTRGERGRGRAGPRGGKNFRRPYLVCKFFPRVETLSIVFPMVELPYDHIFIVIREKNYTSPYRASILSRNVSYFSLINRVVSPWTSFHFHSVRRRAAGLSVCRSLSIHQRMNLCYEYANICK